ncbi:MAG: hypothetical protein ACXW3C_13345 [Pyrinomonadaceae bacterium]
MKNRIKTISKTGLKTLLRLAPVPGLSLILNKGGRRKARRAAGLALLGAGALATVPIALYVICKASGETAQSK